jgi:hypothetical protein
MRLDTRFIGAVYVLGLEDAATVFAAKTREAALGAVTDNISAVAIFTMKKLVYHCSILAQKLTWMTSLYY